MTIFTITAIETGPNPFLEGGEGIINKRVFGYFHSFQEAHRAARENHGEMHEALYNYLVIEEVPSGILATSIVKQWFRWTYEDEPDNRHWKECEWPADISSNILNFGIG